MERSQSAEGLLVDTCLVCEGVFRRLRVACPRTNCNGEVFVAPRGDRICGQCGTKLAMAQLIGLFGQDKKPAYCCECSYTEEPTVVPLGDQWVCLNCLTEYPWTSIRDCEWCGERVTGEVGDYFSPGCVMCGVHIEREVAEMELRNKGVGGNGHGKHQL